MSEINKHIAEFLATLNELLEQGGGEAARLWPVMVQYHWARSFTWCVFSMIVSLCLLGWARTPYKQIDMTHDDDGGFIPATIALTVLGVLTLFFSLTLIPDLLYPEAGYVRHILGK